VISAACLNETESGCWGSKGNLLRDVRPIVGLYTSILPVLPQSTQGSVAPRKWCSQNPFRDSFEIDRIALVDVGGCWLTLREHRVLECKCEELVPSQASSGTPTPNLPDPQAGASASSARTAPFVFNELGAAAAARLVPADARRVCPKVPISPPLVASTLPSDLPTVPPPRRLGAP
jgi:hypothetical protein